jgi:hypothetical protein
MRGHRSGDWRLSHALFIALQRWAGKAVALWRKLAAGMVSDR